MKRENKIIILIIIISILFLLLSISFAEYTKEKRRSKELCNINNELIDLSNGQSNLINQITKNEYELENLTKMECEKKWKIM